MRKYCDYIGFSAPECIIMLAGERILCGYTGIVQKVVNFTRKSIAQHFCRSNILPFLIKQEKSE